MSLYTSASTTAPGQAVTLTASIYAYGSPTGSVTFYDGSAALGTAAVGASTSGPGGQAALTTTALPLGDHTITAVYSGDDVFAANATSPLTETVQQQSSWTYLTSSASTSTSSQSVTFTASVTAYGSPTGSVTFYDGATTLATMAVGPGMYGYGAQATYTTSALSPGIHTITAVYSGDATFAGSNSSALTETVQQTPTWTYVSSSASTSAPGEPVAFTATVGGSSSGAPTGDVTFLDGQTVLGTADVEAGQATLVTSDLSDLGNHVITAVYGGDATFANSTSYALTQTVQLATTSTTLAADAASADGSVTFIATVSSDAALTVAGTVTFFDGQTVLGTADAVAGALGAQAILNTSALSLGNNAITAVYGATTSFAGSSSLALSQFIALAPAAAAANAVPDLTAADLQLGDVDLSKRLDAVIAANKKLTSAEAGVLTALYLDLSRILKYSPIFGVPSVPNPLLAVAKANNDKAHELLLANPDATAAYIEQYFGGINVAQKGLVPGLITQLDNDDFDMREKAQKDLLAMGRGVLPLLQAAKKGTLSAEQTNRIKNITVALYAQFPFTAAQEIPMITLYGGLNISGAEGWAFLTVLAASDPTSSTSQYAQFLLDLNYGGSYVP